VLRDIAERLRGKCEGRELARRRAARGWVSMRAALVARWRARGSAVRAFIRLNTSAISSSETMPSPSASSESSSPASILPSPSLSYAAKAASAPPAPVALP